MGWFVIVFVLNIVDDWFVIVFIVNVVNGLICNCIYIEYSWLVDL